MITYPIGAFVRVVAEADPFRAWAGTVDQLFTDEDGDHVHRVQFGDGSSAFYLADEVVPV